MMRKLLAVLALGGLCAGCGSGDTTAKAAPTGGAAAAPKSEAPTRVSVARAEVGEGKRTLRFLGHTRAALDADLAPAVAGHLVSVKVRSGDRVEKGTVLLSLDGRRARASLEAARARVRGTEAELAQAERQLARVQGVTGQALSDPEREGFALAVARLAARLEAERADVERLDVEAGLYTMRAPFDGVVARRLVDPGDWVTVGTPALSLVSLDALEVHVDLPAEVGAGIEVDHKATLHGAGGEVTATVRGVVPALDDTTRTMRVRLTPDEQPTWLLAGLALDVGVEAELGAEGVLVPRDAVLRGAVDVRVMTVRDGAAHPVEVEILGAVGSRVLVHGEGLEPGTPVIVRGNERLRPGQPVTVSDAGPAAQAAATR